MKMVKVSSESKEWLVFVSWFNEYGYSYEKISKLQVWTVYVKNRDEHDFEDVLFYYYSRYGILFLFICWKYDKQESIVKCLIPFITFNLSLWWI